MVSRKCVTNYQGISSTIGSLVGQSGMEGSIDVARLANDGILVRNCVIRDNSGSTYKALDDLG